MVAHSIARHTPAPSIDSFRIRPFDELLMAKTERFIDSWSIDDVYDRFGTAGTDGQKWLASELTQRARPALIAVHAIGVVGLLDYVYAEGAIHIGIVVDSRFRRLSIGTRLVTALLKSKVPEHPTVAECGIDNWPAVALLRGCNFRRVSVDRHEVVWFHE